MKVLQKMIILLSKHTYLEYYFIQRSEKLLENMLCTAAVAIFTEGLYLNVTLAL